MFKFTILAILICFIWSYQEWQWSEYKSSWFVPSFAEMQERINYEFYCENEAGEVVECNLTYTWAYIINQNLGFYYEFSWLKEDKSITDLRNLTLRELSFFTNAIIHNNKTDWIKYRHKIETEKDFENEINTFLKENWSLNFEDWRYWKRRKNKDWTIDVWICQFNSKWQKGHIEEPNFWTISRQSELCVKKYHWRNKNTFYGEKRKVDYRNNLKKIYVKIL